MKTLFTLAITVLTLPLFAQQLEHDTLYFQDFNDWNYVPIEDTTSQLTSFDGDNKSDASGQGLPGAWFTGNFGNGGADSTEVVALSNSWVSGDPNGQPHERPIARNWLILPKVTLGDSATVLTWKSAPALGHLYMDGYTVVISTSQWLHLDISLGDTLITFAENINADETQFTNGIMHTNFDNNACSTFPGQAVEQCPGLLQEYSVEITGYEGEEVYIAFLHNSEDDNLLALDDIYLSSWMDTTAVVVPEPNAVAELPLSTSMHVYPNPASDVLHVAYTSGNQVTVELYDLTGKQIFQKSSNGNMSESIVNIPMNDLAKGMYFVKTTSGSEVVTKRIMKQ